MPMLGYSKIGYQLSIRTAIKTDSQEKRIITVLSPGRSGTSLLMKSLGAMGMSLSKDLISGSAGNPDGFFEDAEIVKVHKDLLKDLHTSPVLPLPDGWLDSGPTQVAKQRLRVILDNRLSESTSIWGFKDPRTASFLPLWNRILNAPGVVPVFLFAVRNPATVALSMKRQINRDESVTELQWLVRTTDALYHTAADCFIVHYEDWFTQPVVLAENLLRHIGLDRYFTGDVELVLKSIIKPNLNRAAYEDYEIKNEYVLKLYEVLKDCRGNDFDRGKLMSTVKECRKAIRGFRGWAQEAHAALRHSSQNQDRQQKLTAALEKERERNNVLTGEIEEMQKTFSYKLNAKFKEFRKAGRTLPFRSLGLLSLFSKGSRINGRPQGISGTAVIPESEIVKKKLINEYKAIQSRIAELGKKVDETKSADTTIDMARELEELVLYANKLLIDIKELEYSLFEQKSKRYSRRSPDTWMKDIWYSFKRKHPIRKPNSFRLRKQIVDAWRKPGRNTYILPIRLVRHLLEVYSSINILRK